MNVEQYREHCIAKTGVTEGFPFNETTLVFKVGGKMFALADIEEFKSINLKCDPERAQELRESYFGIAPGYHMNKQHWNTVTVDSDVSYALLEELIDHSYSLVRESLPKRIKSELED